MMPSAESLVRHPAGLRLRNCGEAVPELYQKTVKKA